MAATRPKWIENVLYLFTPEDSTVPSAISGKHVLPDVDCKLGRAKAILWIALSLLVSWAMSLL